jgi:DNA-binding transcriptional ArsR family regulator
MRGGEAQVAREIHHPSTDAIDLATVLRALGDPARLTMVRLLADGGELSCTEVQDRLDMPVSTCSYHLRLLREAGITHARASGTVRYVSLRRDDLAARFPGLLDALEADSPAPAAMPAQLGQ